MNSAKLHLFFLFSVILISSGCLNGLNLDSKPITITEDLYEMAKSANSSTNKTVSVDIYLDNSNVRIPEREGIKITHDMGDLVMAKVELTELISLSRHPGVGYIRKVPEANPPFQPPENYTSPGDNSSN
jgi:hypothetical protein